jgi:DNA helicase INO80
MGLGKTI